MHAGRSQERRNSCGTPVDDHNGQHVVTVAHSGKFCIHLFVVKLARHHSSRSLSRRLPRADWGPTSRGANGSICREHFPILLGKVPYPLSKSSLYRPVEYRSKCGTAMRLSSALRRREAGQPRALKGMAQALKAIGFARESLQSPRAPQ